MANGAGIVTVTGHSHTILDHWANLLGWDRYEVEPGKWSQWSQRCSGTTWKVKPEIECNPKVQVLKTTGWVQSLKFEKTWKANDLQVWQMKREKECPTNKKYVYLMGTESSWMQNYKQNCNEICLHTVAVIHFCSALLAQGRIFHHVEPAMGPNFPSKCHSVFRESVVP